MGIYIAPHPLYDFYLHTSKLGGIGTLTDQQIAGAAMAFEANAVLAAVMTVNLLHALTDPRRRGPLATSSPRRRPPRVTVRKCGSWPRVA
jgi:hypothetical protein